MLFGSAIGRPSDWSRVVVTHALRYPAPITGELQIEQSKDLSLRLTFNIPIDNGGSAILGYKLFSLLRIQKVNVELNYR